MTDLTYRIYLVQTGIKSSTYYDNKEASPFNTKLFYFSISRSIEKIVHSERRTGQDHH